MPVFNDSGYKTFYWFDCVREQYFPVNGIKETEKIPVSSNPKTEKSPEDDPELTNDCNYIKEQMNSIIEKRKEQGYVTVGDLVECLEIEPDDYNYDFNPFQLYVGYWDKFEKVTREKAMDIYREYWKIEKVIEDETGVISSDELDELIEKKRDLYHKFMLCNKALDDKSDFEDVMWN